MGILTERRREVLEGDYTGNESTRESHRSNIRASSKEGLAELIAVAESEEIDNEDVFEPEVVEQLLRAIIGPREDIKPLWEYGDRAVMSQLKDYPHKRMMYEAIRNVEGYYQPYFTYYEEPEPNVYASLSNDR